MRRARSTAVPVPTTLALRGPHHEGNCKMILWTILINGIQIDAIQTKIHIPKFLPFSTKLEVNRFMTTSVYSPKKICLVPIHKIPPLSFLLSLIKPYTLSK